MGLLKSSFVFLFWAASCSFAWAAPNYSILVGKQNSGSHQFAQEMVRLWQVPAFKMQGALLMAFEKNAQNRLLRIKNRQGDFTILSPQNAHKFLPENLEIAVISLLWPNVLSVLTTLPELAELNPDPSLSFYIQENSVYFVQTWNQIIPFEAYNPAQFQWFQPGEIPSQAQTLIVTAPPSLEALWLSRGYRLVPLSKAFQASNLQTHPWLALQKFSRNRLTSFPVLVARADTSQNLVKKILNLLYSQKDAVRPHPLFQVLKPGENLLFQKSYRFHSGAKQYFQP